MRHFLATVSQDVFNRVMPTVLRCDCAVIKATRLKLVALLYVYEARFGVLVLS